MKDLARWVDAGLISGEQERAIRDYESRRAGGRVPLFAEVLGYVGAALALMAVLAASASVWEALGDGGRLGLLALVTALLIAGGFSISAAEEPAARRLASFLWFLAVGGAAFFSVILTSDALELADGELLWAGLAIAATAAPLYLLRRTSLQQAALFVAATVLVAAFADAAGSGWFGPLLWAVGAAWLLAAFGRALEPVAVAEGLGAAGLLAGSQWVVLDDLFEGGGWGIALGLASTALLLAASVVRGRPALLAVGTIGLFLFLPQAIDEYLADSIGGPLALFVAGVSLLAAALMSVRLRARVKETGEGAPEGKST